MGKYTRFVRAQILYNHLAASEIPQPYIDAILKDKNYLKIIDHPHFSPRIIETFVGNGTHESCAPTDYFKKILGFFDHPDSVWLDAFSRLGEVAQEALLVLYTMPEPVILEDWKEAYYNFFRVVHKELDSTAKELCRYSPILESETVIDRIEEAYNNYCAYLDEQAEAYQDDYYYGFHGDEKEDAWRIDNLFSSIKERDY